MKTILKSKQNSNVLGITLRPEDELILCCARAKLEDETVQRIKDLIQEDFDWQYFIKKAGFHRVIPLVYPNLNNIAKGIIPNNIFDKISLAFHNNVNRTLLLSGELIKILRLLNERGIAAVPYKGPALSALLYGNVALRPAGDLDIVVQKEHVFKFKHLLAPYGYEPVDKVTNAEEIAYLEDKRKHTYSLINKSKDALIEIHWRITPEYTSPIETKHFWGKLEPFVFNCTKISTLSLEDWLPILCVHASRHRWERLNWLCDIADLIRVQPKINWDSVIQLTHQLDCQRMLFLGLYLAHNLLEVNLPVEVLQKIEADKESVALAYGICQEIFTDNQPKFLAKTIYHIRIKQRWQNKFLYFQSFIRWLITPNKEEHSH
ncbi:hypothetical protein RIVM261_005020 [Rivularia sp. IAM M-261]|nr:hypothetical protein CAL7716_061690 [Calothrix sp. PCC 7716]GJD15546.1 hypothetical protein RIVM261_005020 [Rivularia sp. IAM M-261]